MWDLGLPSDAEVRRGLQETPSSQGTLVFDCLERFVSSVTSFGDKPVVRDLSRTKRVPGPSEIPVLRDGTGRSLSGYLGETRAGVGGLGFTQVVSTLLRKRSLSLESYYFFPLEGVNLTTVKSTPLRYTSIFGTVPGDSGVYLSHTLSYYFCHGH